MVQTIVIENNNPNMLPLIMVTLVTEYLVYSVVSIKIKLNRKKRLETIRKKIVKRHEEIVRREQEKNAKKFHNNFTF